MTIVNCVQEELARFKRILNLTHDTIFIFNDKSLLFEYANKGALEQIGYEPDELMKMTPVDIKPLLDLAQFEELVKPLRTGELNNLKFSTIHAHKSGKEIPVDIVLTHSKEDKRFVAIVRDATNRLETEKSLKGSEQKALHLKALAEQSLLAKTAFFARMSHEIRTPMNGIIGLSDLLAETELSDEQSEFVSQIYESATSLRVILNDILDISKLESGKLILENIPFDFEKVVIDCLNLFNSQAKSKGIELRKDFPIDLPKPLIGDPIRLRQVILNLLSNAVKFTHEGQVRVSITYTQPQKDMILLTASVIDSGVGISEEDLKHIFDSFTQADVSTTRKFGGTGLGTTISKGIVELMGGTITVSSILNEGSQFNVTIPFQCSNEKYTDKKAVPKLERKYNKSVILAEDNLINQMLAVRVLKTLGLTIHVANNGQEAIELCEEVEHDLVLMDIQMPVLNGIEATKQLLSEGYTKPIIAMTANVSRDDIKEYERLGIVGHIAKPYIFNDLVEALDPFLLE